MKAVKRIFQLAMAVFAVLAVYLPYKEYINPGSWTKDSQGIRYVYSDGTHPSDRWIHSNWKLYHVNADGYRETGWIKDGEIEYYLDERGQVVTNRFSEIDGKTVCLDEEGRATRKGFATWKGNSYYIQADGTLAKNQDIEGYHADADGILTLIPPQNTKEYHMTLQDAFAQDNFSLMKEAYDRYLEPGGQEIFYDAMRRFNDGYLDGMTMLRFEIPKAELREEMTVSAVSDLFGYHFFMPGLRDSIRSYAKGVNRNFIGIEVTQYPDRVGIGLKRDPVDPKVLETVANGKARVVEEAMKENGDIARIQKAVKVLMEDKHYVLSDYTHNSYSVYCDNIGLCESFATALTAVLNDMGYETYIQTGKIAAYHGENGHGWTKVKINDEWLDIDPTSLTGGYTDEFILKSDDYFRQHEYVFMKAGEDRKTGDADSKE